MLNKLSVGILGPTGIVGQRFIQLLEHHPWFEVSWLAASDRSEARPYAEAARCGLRTAIPDRVARMIVSRPLRKAPPKIIFARPHVLHRKKELEPQFRAAGCASLQLSACACVRVPGDPRS